MARTSRRATFRQRESAEQRRGAPRVSLFFPVQALEGDLGEERVRLGDRPRHGDEPPPQILGSLSAADGLQIGEWVDHDEETLPWLCVLRIVMSVVHISHLTIIVLP